MSKLVSITLKCNNWLRKLLSTYFNKYKIKLIHNLIEIGRNSCIIGMHQFIKGVENLSEESDHYSTQLQF